MPNTEYYLWSLQFQNWPTPSQYYCSIHQRAELSQAHAHMVGSAVSYCLNTADGTRFLVQKSLWNQREPDELEKPKLFHLEREVRWVAPWLLQPNSDVLPHVSSFLVEDQTLDENTLLLSEVWCILVLGLLVRRFPKLANQQLVPVSRRSRTPISSELSPS
ncbi:hypothetical protein F4823DRAFT_612293 [Ustulina deusta]|nr:hypothetical protein F4823DRAFT_612293 [Ustulina deusta]